MASLGVYRDVTLGLARERWLQASRLLASGVDPSAERKKPKEALLNTFEAVARDWLATLARHVREKKRAASTLKKAQWMLESFVFLNWGSRDHGA